MASAASCAPYMAAYPPARIAAQLSQQLYRGKRMQLAVNAIATPAAQKHPFIVNKLPASASADKWQCRSKAQRVLFPTVFYGKRQSGNAGLPGGSLRRPRGSQRAGQGQGLAFSVVLTAALANASSSPADALEPQAEHGAVVFTTFACPYCKRAKAALREQGVAFREVQLDRSPQLREAVSAATGRRTVPVVYINGRYIGGSDELEELVAQKKLQPLLEAPDQGIPPSIQQLLASEPPIGSAKPASQGQPFDVKDKAQMRRRKLEQIAARMADKETGISRQSVPEGWRTYEGVFSGAAAVAWILKNLPDVLDRSEAEDVGRELQLAKLLHHVSFSEPFSADAETFFRLHADEPSPSAALNAKGVWLKPARPASEVAEELRTRVLELYDVALSPDGKSVNYAAIAGSPEFEAYVAATEELQKVDIGSLTRDEQLAFWINAYNSLIIHAMVEKGQPSNLLQRLVFYIVNKYNVGGYDFSLDDIEHGVLRGNRPGSVSFFGMRPFGLKDPRRFLSIVPREPRIHFALNCGAKSCPPIKIFSAENLDSALDGAVSAFCESEVEVNADTGVVRMSKLLDWYKVDFGSTDEERLQWLLPHLDEKKRASLDGLLKARSFQIEYSKYDWGINDQ